MPATKRRSGPQPFDAVLLVSFGGPGGRDEIRPFLRNVLRARRIPASRVEAVARHYELFDGVSPLTAITRRQAAGLRARLAAAGPPLPVYVGMRNWHPLLEDTLAAMAHDGVRRALAVTLAAHHCYSSCGQYKQNAVTAREALQRAGLPDIELTWAPRWYDHPGFVRANAESIARALDRLPAERRAGARIVFTAHSIPVAMAEESRYEAELKQSAQLVAAALDRRDWALVFQSRSGRPGDPWLEPDVCDYLTAERRQGLEAVVLCPLGFVADHIEVLYDLDHEAAEACRSAGIVCQRATAVNDHPAFVDMLADVVRQAAARYAAGQPLPIVPASPPARSEPPPPVR